MCALLWPETSIDEHRQEIGRLLVSGMYGSLPGAILISYRELGGLNGFLQLGLRLMLMAATLRNQLVSLRAGLFTRISQARVSAGP
jgi:hypothetical protein